MERILKDFVFFLSVEKGLAENTLESYQRDLKKYIQFLNRQEVRDFNETSKKIILEYLAEQKQKGLAVSTLTRNLASIRSFYQYLLQEQIIQENPAGELESPRAEKRLPTVLSFKDIELLLEQPQPRETSV